MARSTLRQWFQRWFPSRLRRRPSPRPLRGRPVLEPLEDRWLPSTITWGNDTPGDWDNSVDWAGGVVPTAADDAVIPFNNITITHNTNAADAAHTVNSAASFSMSAGSLSVSDTAQFNNGLNFSGGTLTGAGTITVNGSTEWGLSGDMSGTGVTILNGDSTIAGALTIDTRTLINRGTVFDFTFITTLDLVNGAAINNDSGATWNLQGDSSTGGNGTFNNLGTLADSSTATVTVNVPFNNSGTVQVQNGALTVVGDGIESGTITISGGTSMTFSAGSDTFTNAALVNGAGTLVVNGNETVTATGAVTFGSANFTFDSSTLTGSGTVTVNSATTWSSGTMSGTGETDLLGGTTISPNGVALDTRTLKNFGTVADNENLALSNAAVIDNVAGATWLLVATNATVFSGTGTFNNAGMFNMSGAGTDSIAVPFNNSGTVHVTSGGLTVLGDGTESGTINIDNSTTMTFSAGSDTFTNGALVQGSGTFVVSGAETLTVTGNVNFGSADFTFDSSTLTGSGTVTVTSATTWNSATMSGTGVTNLQGATTISGNNTLDTRTLNNFGTVTQNTSTLILLNGAVINNDEASWNLASTTDGLRLFSGSGTFNNNQGTLSAASAVTIVLAVPVNNSGDINVQSDTLTLLSGGQSTGGTFVITGGATLDFGGGTYNIDITSFVQGAGNVTFSASTVTVAGTFTPTGAISILNGATANFTHTANDTGSVTFTTLSLTSGGILTGDATVTVTGAATWTGGTMSGAGITVLQGATALSGNDTIDTRTLNNFGTLTQQFTLFGNSTPVINNQTGAVWNINPSPGSVELFGTGTLPGTGTFNNFGAFVVSGTELNFVFGAFNNSGAVTVQGGTLFLAGGGQDMGSDSIAGGATLDYSGGTFNLTNASNVTGAGNITLGSTVNVSGQFSPTGLITITGLANFTNEVNGSGAVTFDALSLIGLGGTLAGSASVTVAGTTSWAGGTMTGTGVTNLEGPTTLTSNGGLLNVRTLNNFGSLTQSGTLIGLSGPVINNESSGVWSLQGNASITANATFNNAGTVSLASNSTLAVTAFQQTAGTLKGGGVLNGNVVINGGVVSPGFSPGILTIQGNYTQNGNAALNVEIDGTTAGSQFSVLAVSGTATLGGTLNIVRTTGFVPAIAQTFQIVTAGGITGTFATVNGLQINGSETFTVSYSATTVVLDVAPPISPPPPTLPLDQLGVITPAANGTAVWTLYNNFIGSTAITTFTFGLATDIPLVGDWNGLGFTTAGVVRPTAGGVAQWSLDTNGDHAFDAGDSVCSFGLITDIPVVGDWNGSGTTKIGTVRALPDGAAQWSLDSNGNGTFDNSDEVTVYGLATDRFGAGHWTGPGKDELAVVRPGPGGTAEWVLNTTGTGVYSPSDTVYTFGLATDTFIVGDWNGDGRTKIGVERPGPNGTAVFTLDTNGDGVYDAGDQVIIIPATAAGSFEFGNWKRLAGLTVTDPPNALVPPLPLDATFQADVNLAINQWAQAGLNSAGLAQLRGLTYSISTLGGGTTALDDGNHIVLDATAAGNGWSEGPTPQPGQIDLVTTLAHEMGHALGLEHSLDPNDVMFATLPTGVRRAPTAADVNALGMQ